MFMYIIIIYLNNSLHTAFYVPIPITISPRKTNQNSPKNDYFIPPTAAVLAFRIRKKRGQEHQPPCRQLPEVRYSDDDEGAEGSAVCVGEVYTVTGISPDEIAL